MYETARKRKRRDIISRVISILEEHTEMSLEGIVKLLEESKLQYKVSVNIVGSLLRGVPCLHRDVHIKKRVRVTYYRFIGNNNRHSSHPNLDVGGNVAGESDDCSSG